ncbi:FeoB-associated Cys-rich membrane protein [Caloranaerobacter azorensis]|nr:FeoB-associated Cys-rich membrane protein [Caloranaerobacter azorensis]
MSSGTIATVIISIIIFGYGIFSIFKSVKKMSKGKCIGCSECNYKCNKMN